MPAMKINGFVFQAGERYAEGHTLTATEASVLSQTYRENLRNNFASEVEEAVKQAAEANGISEEAVTADHLDMQALQEAFDKYAETYEFGVRTRRTSADPVEAVMNTLARQIVGKILAKKGVARKTISKETMDQYVAKVLAQKGAELRAAAERHIAETNAANIDL